MEMRFFSSVQGRAFMRRGKGVYIGCKQKPKATGFVWDTDVVVAIPQSEVDLNLRDYNAAVRRGDLVKRTKAEFDKFRANQDAEQKRLLAERDAQRKAAVEVADSNTDSEEG